MGKNEGYEEAVRLIEESRGEKSLSLALIALNLTELPDSICELTDLEELYLPNNALSCLPESIGNLSKLKKLVVTDNKLSYLPGSISNLINLVSIHADHNQLISLPSKISTLTNLSYLDVKNNQLSSLPDSIGGLVNLQELKVSDNQLSTLPDSIGNLVKLQKLTISDNQLFSLPNSIDNLIKLEILNVNNNQLSFLPDSLGCLVNLILLNVRDNQLSSLPDSIGKLVNLGMLDIGGNQLTSLPESIGNLKGLYFLNISSNQLTSFPESLKQLTRLLGLFLHGNPLLKIPPDILGPTIDTLSDKIEKNNLPKKILEYYFQTRKGKRPLNEAKLILVGRGEVGKTSLVNRLIENKFNKRQKKTDGIKITGWEIELKKNDKIRLNVWDFGGQEIMHATHQFFLTERSLYLLVLDGRGGFEDNDAEYWLKIISSLGEDSPVIIVLNKINAHPFDLNRKALLEKYPFIKAFVKTDCEDAAGINQLLKEIKKETGALENLRVPFPAVWFDIKEKIASMKKNYLSFDEFKKFCTVNGESEDEAHQSLAYYLHQLGIALNYNDDPSLKDTHVLNPHWLTQGIYKILNSNLLAAKNGEITTNDLSKILNKKQYPKEMHYFLLELMRKFELCFQTPKKENSFLIPELLGKNEPRETKGFNQAECLNFQYSYTVLPQGLLPRFIVRTYTLSEGLKRWRSGVILQLEGCKALVKADLSEKKIFISINGPIEKRRKLLALIRSDFERIHGDIKNLLPDELVPVPRYPQTTIPYKKLYELEKNRNQYYNEYIDGKIITLTVSELLNGVEISIKNLEGVKVFVSYCHKDEYYKNQLETHLKILQRQNIISSWDDTKISAGQVLDKQISELLENAKIIIALISPDYLSSDYCYDIELKRALEKSENGEIILIPVLIRHCRWKKEQISKLKLLPKDGKPVKNWKDKDEAWTIIADQVEKIVTDHSNQINRFLKKANRSGGRL